ncbi:MAG TPA: class II glutamine amidotransferase [Thermoplasmata archaeon]|nr:class II glutamine amidotransferase [Thermoplasmata archaeon]
MCRLFGLLTSQDDAAETWLVRSERSLLAQSHASPETAQRDGWGVGWYTDGGRAHVIKGSRGAFEPSEKDRFVTAAKAAVPPLVLGHLRHASNPLGLLPEQLLGLENSQPFDTHTQLFAHNGAIPFPRETRPYLGTYEGRPQGVNDSEVLFWLLVRHTEETNDPLHGFAQSVGDLVRVWQGLGRPKVAPFSGLNVLYAPNPRELWGFCLWTGDHGAGLLDAHRRYYEMTFRATPHRLIVGSEPFDGERNGWTSMPSGTYVHGVRDGSYVQLTRGAIPLPASLDLGPAPA